MQQQTSHTAFAAAAAANAAIRDYVRNHGKRPWSRHHRNELAQLHRRWLDATKAAGQPFFGLGMTPDLVHERSQAAR